MNQGVHAIDLIGWLMGGVKKVSAITRTQFHNIPVEDATMATVEFNNGAIGVIEGSTCAKPAQSTRFEIYCENGSIIFDDKALRSWFLNGEQMVQGDGISAKDVGNDDPTRVLDNAHGYLVRDLIEAIENNTMTSIGPPVRAERQWIRSWQFTSPQKRAGSAALKQKPAEAFFRRFFIEKIRKVDNRG